MPDRRQEKNSLESPRGMHRRLAEQFKELTSSASSTLSQVVRGLPLPMELPWPHSWLQFSIRGFCGHPWFK